MVDFLRAKDELVDHILTDRHQTYGYFLDVASVAIALRAVIRDRRPDLMPDQDEALNMICSKISRIVNGDPNHLDSWRDIAGYATLVAERLEGKSR